MFNVGGGELLVIALVALLVLGPQRLPEAARTLGKVVGEVRRLSSGFQREVRDAFEVDEKREAKTSRREALPLASVVADIDKDEALDDADDDVALLDPTDGVAPEVGDAIDQIVAVPDLPAEPAGESPTPDTPRAPGGRPDIAAAADRTDEIAAGADAADAGDRRDDAPGDARAAS
jgi:sec-independent protein translocase protein TatB